MEAVPLRARDTYPLLVACDANMEPETFLQGKWCRERAMIIRDPAADFPTCRSKGAHEVQVERMFDSLVACRGLKAKLRKVEVLENYDSRPLTLVRFEVRCKKEQQESRILKVSTPPPGVSGGKVPKVENSVQNFLKKTKTKQT